MKRAEVDRGFNRNLKVRSISRFNSLVVTCNNELWLRWNEILESQNRQGISLAWSHNIRRWCTDRVHLMLHQAALNLFT